jgi:hypothetical protein
VCVIAFKKNETARKPPFKRRKLTVVETPQRQPTPSDEDVQTCVSRVLAAAGGRLVCTTCQRAINTRPEFVILCPRYVLMDLTFFESFLLLICRCTSPVCPVCSRTCTAPPPSQPPTPYLTYSPTPIPTPTLPPTSLPLPTSSPKRTALGLASLNINSTSFSGLSAVNGTGAGRRRKFRDEEGNLDAVGEGDTKGDELGSKGCGRVLCRGCCDESWQRLVSIFLNLFLYLCVEVLMLFSCLPSGSTTCLDCYERI